MSNSGKYIDRNPNMRTAGKKLEFKENVYDILKIYSAEEAANNIINTKCKKQIQNMRETDNLGYPPFLPTESVKDLLSPESKKSRFVAFKEKFSEDMFFKKPELGQVQSLESKPNEYNNENFTYGIKNVSSEKAYELILPRKTPHQINQEFLKWHDKYIISHNHYLPAERLTRHYDKSFDPKATFGKPNKVDTTGQMVKKCLQHCERSVAINKAQKMFLDRTEGILGAKIDRYNLNLDPLRTFGKANPPSICDARCLIENTQTCVKKAKLVAALSHLHKLRRSLFNRKDFHMHDLKVLLNKYDESGTGFLSFESIMKTLRSLRIYADEDKLRLVIEQFNISKHQEQDTQLLSIEEFWKIMHIQYPLPHIQILSENTTIGEQNVTTYHLLCEDRNKALNNVLETKRSIDYDDHITAGDVISPDIAMHFGLVRKDFNILRPKEEIKRIFSRILSDQNFEKIWLFGWSKRCAEAACKMSVNEFRTIMDEYNKQNLN